MKKRMTVEYSAPAITETAAAPSRAVVVHAQPSRSALPLSVSPAIVTQQLHRTDSMAILFKSTISENAAFEVIEQAITSGRPCDGYFNAVSDAGETTLVWSPSMSAKEFLATVTDMLRLTWDVARFWIVYERREDRQDPESTAVRNAAFRLTRGYNGVIVASLSILGKRDADHDLELIFVCFAEDFQRRNFRVRYEGKSIST